MKVENMTSSSGNRVANQFVVTGRDDHGHRFRMFQSYNSVIALITYRDETITQIDYEKWDYSKTTGKYRNQFLGETKAETQKKIDSGEYVLSDLNC